MALGSDFGGYINPLVVTQLKQRSAIFEKNDRDIHDLYFLNSRTAWVRLISTTNSPGQEGSLTADLSKKYVLAGGSAYVSEESSDPQVYSSNLRSGINFSNTYDYTKVYNKSSTFGVRPFPGITDFSISTKNAQGTLRKATFKIQVWSLEDFENIETLYFRLKFPLIVEYGHSVYVDNSGTVNRNGIPSLPKEFFEVTSRQEIATIIKRRREDYDFNYDAFIGIVNNFNWTLTPEGYYNCSLELITEGEVIDSLTTEVNVRDEKFNSNSSSSDSQVIFNIYRTGLHFLKYILDQKELTEKNAFGGNIIGRYTKIPYSGSIASNFPEFAAEDSLGLTIGEPSENAEREERVKSLFGYALPANLRDPFGIRAPFDANRVNFVSFRVFLEIVNLVFIKRFSDNFVTFEINDKSTFLTFPNQVSIDPLTAFLPIAPFDTRIDRATPFEFKLEGTNRYGMSFVRNHLPLEPLSVDINSTQEHISNLQIGIESALSTLESILNSDADAEDKDVLTFMRSFLRKIERALGSINEFDITYDEDTNKYIIVDRKVAPILGQQQPTLGSEASLIPDLILTGKQGLASSLDITSKITNKLGAQISIAAQNVSPDYPKDYSGYLRWNRGLVSRLYEDTSAPVEQQSSTRNSTNENALPASPVIQSVDFVPIEYEKFEDKLLVSYEYNVRRIESDDEDYAISRIGAEGPFQILPSTAKQPGFNIRPLVIYKDNNLQIVEEARRLSDAAQGKQIPGVDYNNETFDYLASRRFFLEYTYALYKEFKGDAVKIVAAYNWGIGRVRRLEERVKNREVSDFYSGLPKDTQKYVQDLATVLELSLGEKSPTPYPKRYIWSRLYTALFGDGLNTEPEVSRYRAEVNAIRNDKTNQFLTSIREFYDKFNGGWSTFNYPQDTINALSTIVQDRYNRAAIAYSRRNGILSNGPIPLELSFEIDGISGLKILNSFKIEDSIIPSNYRNYGFIITGLDHQISPNRWTTKVRAQTWFIPGELDGEQERQESNEALNIISQFYQIND